ncbi:site-specific DNA-methyltransferase (adenine-specific) [Fructilactobacillus florum DSM 22689 = JCM 16035]|uniref:Site-specific DNA-methyltransferase (Adenine-specific) n=1 Tax=Fructilactobacillus florum DSM 22689 = JCM 16035 TaxID=1423745 RepID=A0A0R2CJV8_9LACO|nr:Type III restriction-modification system methylation subunit [Fructilactobacillus florum 2F]KRM91767.1 site-specific DNA-methyltransferase (adenine-specific) [Fructilactobacillus florum DSM 22689 = JCM 16035]
MKEKLPEFFDSNDHFSIDKFENALREHNIDEVTNGYQLDFIGKDYARRQVGEVSETVIVPDEKQNNGEGQHSKNLFFTGDNLEVLRQLQAAYSDSIDVIYIDPPYNTGNNDFTYPDNFEYSDEQLQNMLGLDDDALARLKSIQGKSSHSAWLTFMYPRLSLAKKLLKNNGVIFISIDDNEAANLKEISDEIFGENNFLAQIVWERAYAPINLKRNFSVSHDYMLVYGRDAQIIKTNGIQRTNTADNRYQNPDSDPRGVWKSDNLSVGPANKRNIYPITTPSGRVVEPPAGRSWRLSQKEFRERLADKRIWFGKDGNSVPGIKRFLSDLKKTGITPMTIWKREDVGDSQAATQYLQKLMNNKSYFSYPKPVKLIQRAIQLYASKEATVMDFFAGSATTAEAVMQQNIVDGGHRKFIMVQLPEKTYYLNKSGSKVPTKGGEDAFENGFESIDEIARERIRRAAQKIKADNELTLPTDFDGSFKHYRVVRPVKKTVAAVHEFDINKTNLFSDMLGSFSSTALNVAGDVSGTGTIMTTWLARDGYPFDVAVKSIDFASYQAHIINDEALYLINEGWNSQQTKLLLNQLGKHELDLRNVVIFVYSFKLDALLELENGLKQLDNDVSLLRRY